MKYRKVICLVVFLSFCGLPLCASNAKPARNQSRVQSAADLTAYECFYATCMDTCKGAIDSCPLFLLAYQVSKSMMYYGSAHKKNDDKPQDDWILFDEDSKTTENIFPISDQDYRPRRVQKKTWEEREQIRLDAIQKLRNRVIIESLRNDDDIEQQLQDDHDMHQWLLPIKDIQNRNYKLKVTGFDVTDDLALPALENCDVAVQSHRINRN